MVIQTEPYLFAHMHARTHVRACNHSLTPDIQASKTHTHTHTKVGGQKSNPIPGEAEIGVPGSVLSFKCRE